MDQRPSQMTEPLKVALLGLPERTHSVLQAYIEGPGRHLYRLADGEDAEAAIVDFDHPGSRYLWTEFSAQSKRPGILLSIAAQNEANAYWIAKPFTSEDMARAAPLAATSARAHPAPKPSPNPPAATAPATPQPPAAPLAADTSEPAMPPPKLQRAVAAPGFLTESPAAASAPVGIAPSSGKSPWLLPGAVTVVLLIALGFVWRNQPGNGQTAAQQDAGVVAVAVQSALGAPHTPASAEEQRFIAAQMAELKQREQSGDAELKSRLDRLAADPKARQEYVHSVYNKVHIDGATAGATHSAERDTRSRIDALVSRAMSETQDKSGDFVAALGDAAREREAQMRTIEVQPGDTLGAIAERAYGDRKLYMKIFAANPRILTSPDHIFPGQILRVPAV